MIVGLMGKKRSGKDSAGQHLVAQHGFHRVGFADKLREMALAINPLVGADLRLQTLVTWFGWEKAKESAEVRGLLQRLGTEGVRDVLGPNTWVDAAMLEVDEAILLDPDPDFVFTDVRFKNEAQAIRDRGGLIWKIERPHMLDDGDKHPSEVDLEQIRPDAFILNAAPFPDRLHQNLDWELDRSTR